MSDIAVADPAATNWNFADIYEAIASAVPDRPCQFMGDREISWKQFDRRANALAVDLPAAGLGHQSKLALYLHNCPEYLESMIAGFKVSVAPVAVPTSPASVRDDEPSAGIAQADTEELGRTLRALHDRTGVTMIVIEHDLPLLASICDRLVAMEVGTLIADGVPAAVQADPAVIASYIGSSDFALNRSGGA